MWRSLFIMLVIVWLAGCTNTRLYDSLEFLPRSHELSRYHSISGIHSSILAEYFTPQAHLALSQIPVIDGLMLQPFVVGVNFWSISAGIITVNGYDRKVVISRHHLLTADANTIIHEYMHHLDDMDRDGIADWINHQEFASAFHKLLADPNYNKKALELLDSSNRFITDVFGIGPMSELIAYTGSWIARGNGPEYLRLVFRKIFLGCAVNISS